MFVSRRVCSATPLQSDYVFFVSSAPAPSCDRAFCFFIVSPAPMLEGAGDCVSPVARLRGMDYYAWCLTWCCGFPVVLAGGQ
mmetsp:Transcript_18586/g.44768  ORF Transcript_18586/g.44768 Transcript_18586/m.44768 type:complete len:82 (-) Transcript_18586:8-253(-)